MYRMRAWCITIRRSILGEISESVNSYNVVQREISNAKGKQLNLVISSGGGSVTEGMAIADLIANDVKPWTPNV